MTIVKYLIFHLSKKKEKRKAISFFEAVENSV
jgi:hypothetical protein